MNRLARVKQVFQTFKKHNAGTASAGPNVPPVREEKAEKKVESEGPKNRVKDVLDVSFNNAEAAYRSKTTWEVFRALIVYTMCSFNYLVENNMGIMKATQKIFGEKIFILIMKATFYGHFVAGEDQHKITPVLKRLRSFGVKPILDYSVEEDLSREEAEKREADSNLTEIKMKPEDALGEMPQYAVNKTFLDRRYKVQSARTYFYLNEATCEKNVEIFIDCLQAVAGATYGTGITAIKLTALGRPQLLLLISQVIMRARQFVSEVHKGQGNVIGHHLSVDELSKRLEKAGIKDSKKFLENVVRDSEGVIHLFPWSGIIDENFQLSETFMVPSLKDGRMVKLISQLPKAEEEMFRNMIRRVNTLVKTAKELDVRIMIDAEQTYFQPAISRITLEMMNKYNRDKAIVFNTYQCYLREAINEVSMDLEQAHRQKFYFGCKLVRGAYMDQERARASAMGYADPINPNFEATTEMYHKTLSECLRRIQKLKDEGKSLGHIGIMVASHNEDTIRFALQKMSEMNIPPESKVICFGQLLGMCDYITFPLGQSGYSAYKYIPYGPVKEVLPYLSRRAQENKGILKKVKKEKQLIRKELLRRLMKGDIFYKPKGSYSPV
ncbi:proline dehydrogenase 1, mitochondrial-like [Cimex lectularius]|uniref:Proline dehydrogenase n=1 Tax=Cimex lectularius TaxID=79782 RepID=A0A8I6R9U2_CIMLE|nr:proline dehydrogenase 1, mitochondrial-like [Cimex lectularius]